MSKVTTIPRLGQVLRAAIKAAGLRPRIDALGLGKDLDDLAIEARPGATFRLIQAIEDACAKAVSDDAGPQWGEVFRSTWGHTRRSMQHLVQSAAIDAIPAEEGRALYERLVTVPALSGYLSYCQSESRGPDLDIWWTSPFKAWVQFASSIAGVPAEKVETNLANHLDVDQRTLDRWAAGEPIGTICWPYRPIILQAVGEQAAKKLGNDAAQRLTGWLMIAVAFQSLSPARHDTVRRDFSMHSQVRRSVDDAVSAINQRALTCGAGPIRTAAIPILERIEHLFAARQPQHAAEIREQLNAFNAVICKLEPEARQAYQYIHDWFSARLAAIEGKSNAALRLYRAAVEAVWWSGGQNQHPILNEALLYAVGIGDKVAAERYWDKTFLLGLNRGPKRPLEEQELRRIASGFEKMFYPQKATHRIPPPIEAVFQDQDFRLDPKDLSNPNRKVKFAEGRIRRTPFMDAIRDGTLDDVKQMLAAGGDPDDYIKESGEGPLSFAMRRACDRKDPAIMNYLLGLDLLPETVNRPVSTKRESPLAQFPLISMRLARIWGPRRALPSARTRADRRSRCVRCARTAESSNKSTTIFISWVSRHGSRKHRTGAVELQSSA